MAKLVLMCGKTHSGKTTFGKKLSQILKRSIVIDNDEIDLVLKEKFTVIFNDEFALSRRSAENPTLPLRIQRVIAEYCLENNFNVILTASHSKKVIRDKARDIANKTSSSLIIVFMNIADRLIESNIATTQRSTDVLKEYKDFNEVLYKQNHGMFDPPSVDEADYFFEIKDYTEVDMVLKSIVDLKI